MAERRSRTNLYSGPLVEIQRRDLPALERKGNFVAEAKMDGAWCALHVSEENHRFESRTGLEFEGSEIEGLEGIDLGSKLDGTILVGELEVASEIATKAFRVNGYRRIWLFDVIAFRGKDLRDIVYKDRRELLHQTIFRSVPVESRNRVHLVDWATSGFVKFYDRVIAEGGEGLVVKPLNSTCRPTRADGKTPEMMRVKPWRTVDYVVVGAEKTAEGISARLALWSDGKLRVVMRAPLEGLELTFEAEGKSNMDGKIVEMRGRELGASGALRHAQFSRYRSDKSVEDCTGEVKKVEI